MSTGAVGGGTLGECSYVSLDSPPCLSSVQPGAPCHGGPGVAAPRLRGRGGSLGGGRTTRARLRQGAHAQRVRLCPPVQLLALQRQPGGWHGNQVGGIIGMATK